MPGVRRPPGLLGGLDRRPAQQLRAGLGELAGARALPGLLDAWRQPGVADQLACRRGSAPMSPITTAIVRPSRSPTPGIVVKQHDAIVGAGERAELTLQAAPAAGRAGRRRRSPRRPSGATPRARRARSSSSSASGWRSRVSGKLDAELAEHAVGAVLRRGAQPDQVHPPPQPLLERTLVERGHPQLPARDRAGRARPARARRPCRSCAASGASALTLRASAICDRPAGGLEPLAHPGGAAHHLHARLHLGAKPRCQAAQARPRPPASSPPSSTARRSPSRTSVRVRIPNRFRHTAAPRASFRIVTNAGVCAGREVPSS